MKRSAFALLVLALSAAAAWAQSTGGSFTAPDGQPVPGEMVLVPCGPIVNGQPSACPPGAANGLPVICNNCSPSAPVGASSNPVNGTITNGILSPSAAPGTSTVSGGALGATTYYVKVTYVDPAGETLVSAESSQAVGANNLLVVTSPAAYLNATGYNVYAATSSGTETKQNSSPIAIGTNWTEPTSGLVAGTNPPSANTAINFQSLLALNANRKGCTFQNQGANPQYFSIAAVPALANSIKVPPGAYFYCSGPSNVTIIDAVQLSGTAGDAFAGQWQ